jgi:hypothetical protein
MDFEAYILPDNLDYYSAAKPLESVYLEFVRKNIGEILDLGEFEALRRWLCGTKVCMPIAVTGNDSHRITREFYKALRKEQKGK